MDYRCKKRSHPVSAPSRHVRRNARKLLLFAAFAFVAAATACAPRSSASGSGNRNVISIEEVQELNRLNVFDLVQRLRPSWLQTRGVDSFQQSNAVVAYLDGTRYGLARDLRNVRSTDVLEVRYLDSRQATMRFGVGHPSGAILVITRR